MIAELDLHYVHSDEFQEPGARKRILAREPAGNPPDRRPPGEPDPYLASLYEIPLLTPELEVYLFRKMNFLLYEASQLRSGGARARAVRSRHARAEVVRNRLIEANLRLVVNVAKKWISPHCHLHELISEGNMGLRKAVRRFDYSLGYKFSTYARISIDRVVSRARQVFFRDGSRFSTNHEDGVFRGRQDPLPPAAEQARLREDAETVARLLRTLDPRRRRVLECRFGLNGQTPMILKQVGAVMGLTRERVRQLEKDAMGSIGAKAKQEGLI
jgi:RNA polymerase primary sigma factor/RNA polymerase sigma factor